MDALDLLRRYGLQPSKGLGQNFLVADWVYERILDASALDRGAIVLEIGPGLGTLTRRLAARARRVIAVELDRRLIPILEEALAEFANVALVRGDILALDPVALLCEQLQVPAEQLAYHVVANLPYYITSHVLRHLLMARVRPRQMTLLVQREVAERITAKPGEMSLLALSVQVFGAPRLICRVPPSAFVPRPKVSSAVLTVHIYPQPLIAEERLGTFFTVVRAAFEQKRKQLLNSLAVGLALDKAMIEKALMVAGIDPSRRPQMLSVEEWARLAVRLEPYLGSGSGEPPGDPDMGAEGFVIT